ncbi:carboxymuconolactone decarboxylase family protein [Nocardia otitidiscaviarum]|uniref:carboxymuconolactone decarboxylase family protein n=1 Tax=Nocardia otitidiscaviarum TaxID=1823 RepID=UPI0018951BA1|nr:carboxymuconolactone decarboxylase family protein [Nocardia otitidiscaviarum]MBF6237330.1 carboxymuconolactone decarboxylase family protein [Nocardia otitidiscaviarum]
MNNVPSTLAAADRFERGAAVLRSVSGTEHPEALDSLADIAPDLARLTVEFAYGDINARPGPTLPQRQLATVAALAALGNAMPQLRFHIDGALNVGCAPGEIVEVLIHVSLYAGFPAALNALTVAREAFRARPDIDFTPTTVPAAADRFDRGRTTLSAVDGHAGEQVIAALADIAPDLGRYIIEFGFGDIYSRPGLDLRSRELATVAMCTALGTAAPQLKVHLHGLLNVGGTRAEAVEVIMQMAVYAGFPAALNGITAARAVFAERDERGGAGRE